MHEKMNIYIKKSKNQKIKKLTTKEKKLKKSLHVIFLLIFVFFLESAVDMSVRKTTGYRTIF